MGKIIVGSVTHISEIYGGGSIAPGSIHHPAESDIFVPLPGRLDHKVGEAPVQYGIEGIDMDLVEVLCRFAIRFKKESASSGLWKMSAADPSQAMNWYFLL